MPTIASGSNATITVAQGASIQLNSDKTSVARVEVTSGVDSGKVITVNHAGQMVYGPFNAGNVLISAVSGAVDYENPWDRDPSLGATWSDSTGTALVGPDGSSRPASLGVFTWAQLQAAYPNGSASLAALPAGTTVVVSGGMGQGGRYTMTPNLAGTRWVPVNGTASLAVYAGDLAAPVATWAGAVGKASLPGGDPVLVGLAAGDKLTISAHARKRGANATAQIRVRIGTTGTYNTDASTGADTIAINDLRDFYRHSIVTFGDKTSFCSTAGLGPGAQATGTAFDSTGNVDLDSTMYAIIEVSSINASDFVDLVHFSILWEAAP